MSGMFFTKTTKENLAWRMKALAAQENNDGEEYNLLQMGAERIEELERLCKTEFEELSDDDYSEWENTAGRSRIKELECELRDMQTADTHMEFISRVQDAGLHKLYDIITDQLFKYERELNRG